MYLEIVTPDNKVFEGEVSVATFPGIDGSFQILNNHAPIISALAKGRLAYQSEDGSSSELVIDGGVVEVLNNRIVVLAEGVE